MGRVAARRRTLLCGMPIVWLDWARRFLFAQPSIFLISQTVNDLASLTPEVRFRAIHGETSDRVIADIIDHTKHTSLDGEILFLTHAAMVLLPYLHRRQD